MARTPARKKLEKVVEENPIKTTQKFYCCRCGTSFSRRVGNFSVSHSSMYRGTGYLPMCNQCVDAMYEQYRAQFNDDRKAMKRICMKLDLYWNNDIYEMTEKAAGVHSRVRNYIGRTNIVRYLDKTYDNTVEEEELENSRVYGNSTFYVAKDTDEISQVDQETVDFWGAGYTPDFYDELNRRYNDWTNGSDVTDPSERSLYRQICLLETIISRDGAQGKPVDKNVNVLNSLLGSMNLKPAQKKSESDTELEKMPLGVGIQKWELSRPLPQTSKSKKDVRNTIKNITTWYLGHACKMVGLRNSYCKMYEDAMEELRVKHPEYDEEDDDTLLNDIFRGTTSSDASTGGDG